MLPPSSICPSTIPTESFAVRQSRLRRHLRRVSGINRPNTWEHPTKKSLRCYDQSFADVRDDAMKTTMKDDYDDAVDHPLRPSRRKMARRPCRRKQPLIHSSLEYRNWLPLHRPLNRLRFHLLWLLLLPLPPLPRWPAAGSSVRSIQV